MNKLSLELLEKIFLCVPTKQIRLNMLCINKQITRLLTSNRFWIKKCPYINPKVLDTLKQFNGNQVRYILWYASLVIEDATLYSSINTQYILNNHDKVIVMEYVGWLIGSNSDKHPSYINFTFKGENLHESYLFLKIVAALGIPLIYTYIHSSKDNLVTYFDIQKYDSIFDIIMLRRNLKIIG